MAGCFANAGRMLSPLQTSVWCIYSGLINAREQFQVAERLIEKHNRQTVIVDIGNVKHPGMSVYYLLIANPLSV